LDETLRIAGAILKHERAVARRRGSPARRRRRYGLRMSGRRGVGVALTVVALAGGLLGCSSGTSPGGDRSPGGALAPTAPGPATATTSASPAGPLFDAAGMALCDETDVAPLAGLGLRVRDTVGRPPPSAPGAACLIQLTGSGRTGSLLVEAATPPSIEEATRLYDATRDVTVMRPAGDLAGVGERAEAFTGRSGAGGATAEYMIRARSGNLVVKVWLSVTGGSETALPAPVRRIAVATLAQVPPA
jgi:hypothetical protein